LRLMNFSFNNVRLYPPTHQKVNEVITELHEILRPVFEEQEDVGFGFMDEMLYIEGAMSIEETKSNEMLVDRFTKCRVKYLTIAKTVEKNDLFEFFRLMNEEAKKTIADPPGEVLARNNVKNLHVVEAEVSDTASKSKLGRRKTLLDWYFKAVETVRSTHEQLIRGEKTDLKTLYRLADDLMATMRTKGGEPFLLLPFLERDMDPHIAHQVNTAIYCCSLSEVYGLNSGQTQTLCLAALLHDIGRCVIPKEWVGAAPLSPFEWAVVFQHPTWSFLLLSRNEDIPLPMALIGAKHHRHKGQEKEGDYVPDVFHKVLNLADAYDRSAWAARIYWKKFPKHRFLKHILHERGTWYEPALTKLIAQVVGYFPVGSLVRLRDGQRGIVVRSNAENLDRPKVYLIDAAPPAPTDEDRQKSELLKAVDVIEEPPPVILDLMDLEDDGLRYKNDVVTVLDPGAEGVDIRALLDKKKEYLLSFAL